MTNANFISIYDPDYDVFRVVEYVGNPVSMNRNLKTYIDKYYRDLPEKDKTTLVNETKYS